MTFLWKLYPWSFVFSFMRSFFSVVWGIDFFLYFSSVHTFGFRLTVLHYPFVPTCFSVHNFFPLCSFVHRCFHYPPSLSICPYTLSYENLSFSDHLSVQSFVIVLLCQYMSVHASVKSSFSANLSVHDFVRLNKPNLIFSVKECDGCWVCLPNS